MPADTTETAAEHSARLQPSISLHAPVTAFMFSCSGTNVNVCPGYDVKLCPGYDVKLIRCVLIMTLNSSGANKEMIL